jgi:hypothetical protein
MLDNGHPNIVDNGFTQMMDNQTRWIKTLIHMALITSTFKHSNPNTHAFGDLVIQTQTF